MEKIPLFVGVPTYPQVSRHAVEAWLKLDLPAGTIWRFVEGTDVGQIRNQLVTEFLESGAPRILFLDCDIVPPPLAYRRMSDSWTKDIMLGKYRNRVTGEPIAGMGFAVIYREVFFKIPAPWFVWERGSFSEDVYFLARARDNGIDFESYEIGLGHLATRLLKENGESPL